MNTSSVVGASGLVGKKILETLAGNCSVRAWIRRPVDLPPGIDTVVSENIPSAEDIFWNVDALFIALGTTIGKAGSREAFASVDLDLVVECARRAREAGVGTLALVSAAGAAPDSRIFYNRVKGLAEESVNALGFPRVAIARPSLLLGDRGEFRFSEKLARTILGPMRRLLPSSWRPVHDHEVAASLVKAADDPSWTGIRILDNTSLVRGC